MLPMNHSRHNAAACLGCPHRVKIGSLCTISGRKYTDHIPDGSCPKGKHRPPGPLPALPPPVASPAEAELVAAIKAKAAGDVIEEIIHRVGIDRLAKVYSLITGKPCGCADRKKWMNEYFPDPSPKGVAKSFLKLIGW